MSLSGRTSRSRSLDGTVPLKRDYQSSTSSCDSASSYADSRRLLLNGVARRMDYESVSGNESVSFPLQTFERSRLPSYTDLSVRGSEHCVRMNISGLPVVARSRLFLRTYWKQILFCILFQTICTIVAQAVIFMIKESATHAARKAISPRVCPESQVFDVAKMCRSTSDHFCDRCLDVCFYG